MKHAKILGLQTSSDRTWNNLMFEIVKKVSKRVYFLRQLKRSHVKLKELLLFYFTWIRPVTEYARLVYHHNLPQYLSFDLEECQKGASRIIYADCSYDKTDWVNPLQLHERRELLSDKLSNSILCNPSYELYSLLPSKNEGEVNLRVKRAHSLLTLAMILSITMLIRQWCKYPLF